MEPWVEVHRRAGDLWFRGPVGHRGRAPSEVPGGRDSRERALRRLERPRPQLTGLRRGSLGDRSSLAAVSIGRVFGAFEVLGLVDRFELGLLLPAPYALLAISARDVSARPLPTGPAARTQFLARLQLSLERVLDGELASWRLDHVVPAIADLTVVVESSPLVTNRLVAVVSGHGRRRWNELANLTVGDVRDWNGAGAKLTAQLITAGVDASIRMIEGQPSVPQIETSNGRPVPARSGLTGTLDACLAGIRDRRQQTAFELHDLRLDDPFDSPAPGARIDR